jgi:hypothetical protein
MRQPPAPHAIASAVVAFLLQGWLALGLDGTVGGNDLQFAETVYAELRGTDVATSIPYHHIDLWLMPFEDACSEMTSLLGDLHELRLQLDDGLAAEDYCEQWEDRFAGATGGEAFWVGQLRMQALPRGENETPQTTYAFYEEAEGDVPPGPAFDGDLAHYNTPDFEACAQEFSGTEEYGPATYAITDGTVEVRDYEEDEAIEAKLSVAAEEEARGPLAGKVDAEFCPEALQWPLVFGLGLEEPPSAR